MGERPLIVLDTHAWVWWVSDPPRIPARARRVVDAASQAGASVFVSSISAWEVAMLVSRGRLELTLDVTTWIAHAEAVPPLRFVAVDNRIAVRAAMLGDCPSRDPADRIIVATALGLGARLVTGDARLRRYDRVATVWS